MGVLSVTAVNSAPYGSPLLRGIDFQLRAGEILGLIGPNGAGKSTLMHTIAGGIPLEAGEILLNGSPLASWGPVERARALAMQTQHSALNFPFTVEEVILLGRIPHASGHEADRRVLAQVLEATDTGELRKRPYTQLSGGEKQRVQLARTVAQLWRTQDSPARLLLLDEPSSALDLSHQRVVMDLVTRLAADGCSAVVATHDFNLLAAHADQLLLLQGGKQHSRGTPDQVLTSDMFAEVFKVDVLVQRHPDNRSPLVIQR